MDEENSEDKMEVHDNKETENDEIAESSDSDDENQTFSKRKRKVRCLSDSDSETPQSKETNSIDNTNSNEDSPNKIKGNGIESDSTDAESTHEDGELLSDRPKSQRVEKKNNMISKKFEKLFQPKESRVENKEDYSNVKSKLSMICDSDSSDDESNSREESKSVSDYGSAELSQEPKSRGTQRMSAKIAMEQMQKIKSESSRMLREKEISLPYHKPKQISLKDIMAKKNIQFVPGAKKPNLRMNEEQLREYVSQLEKREKEIQELYESSSEDEKDNDNEVSCDTKDEPDTEIQPSTNSEILENETQPFTNSEILESETQPFTNSEILESETQPIESDDVSKASDSSLQSDENGVIINDDVGSLPNCSDSVADIPVETEQSDLSVDNQEESVIEKETTVCNDIEISICNIDGLNGSEEVEDNTLTESSSALLNNSQSFENTKNYLESLKTQLLSGLREKPKLSGTSDGLIDFSDGTEELTGVNAFKKKFFYHANLKTPVEMEREKEKRTVPGTALMNFRRELEDQIREQKLQEWKRKREESQAKNLEEKTDELSDCEEILEKDNEEKQNNENAEDLANESNTEIEEDEEEDDYVLIEKKSKKKCDYIEDEAELDDDSFEDDENDKEETDIESDVPDLNKSHEKKKLNRIYNPFEGSDSSDDNEESNKNEDKLIPINKLQTKSTDESIQNKELDSADIFGTPERQKSENFSMDCSLDDSLPLGQKCVSDESFSSTKNNTSENFTKQVSNLNVSLIELSTIGQDKTSPQNIRSTILDRINQELNDTEPINCTSYTQEIADMCSGDFAPEKSDSVPSGVKNLISSLNEDANSTQMSQNTENELLELCTGKFVDVEETTTEKTINSQNLNEYTPENEKGNVIKKKTNGIESFLVSCPKQNKNLSEDVNVEEKNENVLNAKYALLSTSSDEKENCDDTETKKKRLLKSRHDRNKTRKAKPLEESDDESDNEIHDDDENSNNSSISDAEEAKEINYDSEENEIEVLPENVTPKSKPAKSSEFFEQEADLTTDDEWKGSGDEDERGLDEFEWEEGDADQLDHRKINKELERIHRHQMLDQHSREIKILQDILLEDGDLEGGTRERKFRWKNIDNTIESGAVVGEDKQDDFDDTQNEEQWRKQRYERETYLRELNKEAEQEEKEPVQIPTRLSIIKASLKQSLTSVQSEDMSVNFILKPNEKNQEQDKSNKKSTTVPSPVKKAFMTIQNQYKKSYLSKSQATLNRLSLLTKNINTNSNGENPSANLSSLAPGKKKNFVFQTVSPPCNNNMTEDMKLKKRKAVAEISTPKLMKKMKLTDNQIPKSRKSLIDHMD